MNYYKWYPDNEMPVYYSEDIVLKILKSATEKLKKKLELRKELKLNSILRWKSTTIDMHILKLSDIYKRKGNVLKEGNFLEGGGLKKIKLNVVLSEKEKIKISDEFNFGAELEIDTILGVRKRWCLSIKDSYYENVFERGIGWVDSYSEEYFHTLKELYNYLKNKMKHWKNWKQYSCEVQVYVDNQFKKGRLELFPAGSFFKTNKIFFFLDCKNFNLNEVVINEDNWEYYQGKFDPIYHFSSLIGKDTTVYCDPLENIIGWNDHVACSLYIYVEGI